MNNPLVQPDPGLFIWTLVTFLVLLALLAKFAWRPLLQALFMIARVLTTKSPIAVRTIKTEAFIATSITARPPSHQPPD